MYSLQVAGQEESLVLVARRGEALPPPGVADLRVAARAAAQAAAMRLRALNLPYISPTSRLHLGYLSPISPQAAGMRLRAGKLVRRLLWVEVREDEAGGGVVELRPPATTGRVPWWNLSGRVPWWRRVGRQDTSACERLSGGGGRGSNA